MQEKTIDGLLAEIDELKVRLDKREMQLTDAISTATKVLDELATANAQLQTQTENMRELREFVGQIAGALHVDDLPFYIIRQAEDLIVRVTI